MSPDRYAGAAEGWATGASLVYDPIAEELVGRSPHPLRGRRVLDAGAGTGAVTAALVARGAVPIAADLSLDMLARAARSRPPGIVADVRALPLAGGSVDGAVAAFVLNHLPDPEAGFGELARVTRRGGAILASVFAAANRSAARDRVDEVALAEGWEPPGWYVDLKDRCMPLLGDAGRMAAAARAAGVDEVKAEERAVDVGVTQPEQLVRYRLGQAQFTEWLAGMGPGRAEAVRRRAADAARPVMEDYRPLVVFLHGRVGGAER